MKCVLMQPYFFPYLGYFQLANCADTFVFYDDCAYRKQGWINRNRILFHNKAHLVSLPIKSRSSFKMINETEVHSDISYKNKILSKVRESYHFAPFFSEIYPILEDIIMDNEIQLSRYLTNGLNKLFKILNIKNHIQYSSEFKKDSSLNAEEKIISVCQKLKATEYVNSSGGKELYSKKHFSEKGIQLYFLNSKPYSYFQFNKEEFIPDLSIIDVLMFNSIKEITNQISGNHSFE